MIDALLRTNLDPHRDSPNTPKAMFVNFPALPQVGNGFNWGYHRCKFTAIGWELDPKTGNMLLIVEFNK